MVALAPGEMPKASEARPPNCNYFKDASIEGWGAHRGATTAEGQWSQAELGCHINELELWAIYFVLKSLGTTTDIHIKIRWHNCLEWFLSARVFNVICTEFGLPDIDLFASCLNKKVGKFVSWGPDPDAWAVDAFPLTWTNACFYIFPPFSLVGRALQKVLADNSDAVCGTAWPSQPWFTRLRREASQVLRFKKKKDLLPQGNPINKEDLSVCPLGAFRFYTKNFFK